MLWVEVVRIVSARRPRHPCPPSARNPPAEQHLPPVHRYVNGAPPRIQFWLHTMDHDTAALAVETIRRWWLGMGKPVYPQAHQLLITADSGGSNGARVRLWKVELQRLADETGLRVSVCHLPPGTSKWNKIEHRLFSYVSQNWRGKPLISYEVIVNLIAATRTESGLGVHSEVDTKTYPAGVKVPDNEMAQVALRPDKFHGDWNYTIIPRARKH
jgi:hypothetical protein